VRNQRSWESQFERQSWIRLCIWYRRVRGTNLPTRRWLVHCDRIGFVRFGGDPSIVGLESALRGTERLIGASPDQLIPGSFVTDPSQTLRQLRPDQIVIVAALDLPTMIPAPAGNPNFPEATLPLDLS
jgi:hypothetical protein